MLAVTPMLSWAADAPPPARQPLAGWVLIRTASAGGQLIAHCRELNYWEDAALRTGDIFHGLPVTAVATSEVLLGASWCIPLDGRLQRGQVPQPPRSRDALRRAARRMPPSPAYERLLERAAARLTRPSREADHGPTPR